MALQEYSKSGPLKGGGLEDCQQVVQSPDWNELNCIIPRDQVLTRLSGKRKTVSLTEPIMAIHFDRKGNCFIQTNAHLYKYLATDVTGDVNAGGGFL